MGRRTGKKVIHDHYYFDTFIIIIYRVDIETDCCKTVEAVASITSVSQTVDAAGVLNAMTFTVSSPPR